MPQINVQSFRRSEMLDITSAVQEKVSVSGVKSGFAVLFVPHTTAGITINEGHDPDVASDMLEKLSRLVPQKEAFHRHFEGNSDAHVKASLVGSSVTVPIENSSLALGAWQKIFLCEFDGPRKRKVIVKAVHG